MKFTKEQAFEKLKSILTNSGKKPLRMSEKSINEQLETLIPLIADEEIELDDFVNKVKPTFETMNANAGHDQSTFVKEWEKNHPVPKKDDDDDDDDKNGEGGGGSGDKDPMKKLLKRIEELENKEKEREMEQLSKKKNKELLSALKKKGVDDDEWSKAMLEEITITPETDVESKAETLLKLYNKSKSTTTRFTPGDPNADDKPKDVFAEARKIIQARNQTRDNKKNE